MERYNPKELEPRWQDYWFKWNIYQTPDKSSKKKHYTLVEFPYPSGEGLHVGHAFSMTGADVYARKKRMEGYNVLFPMGWDAFGLPTENYAIRTGIKPQVATDKNTVKFKRQMMRLGFSFDWDREVNTTDPSYYKWTQWIFTQLFKHGLAYKKEMPINWCPSCKIGLANEEVVRGKIKNQKLKIKNESRSDSVVATLRVANSDGEEYQNVCERCGTPVIKKELSQWIVKITDYAGRLISGLDKTDFIEKVKAAQVNWIGKSIGVEIDYPIVGKENSRISCYSTRPDTNFGATFVVISPEHVLVDLLTTIDNKKLVAAYKEAARKKSEREREDPKKEKTGVFTGSFCLNRLTGKKMPIYVADFVVLTAGTGIVVGVPAHDRRDFDFAKKYGLEIIPVIKPFGGEIWDYDEKPFVDIDDAEVFNSDFLNGLKAKDAKEKIIEYLVAKGWGRRASNYHLRDWIFSRQHYWGEPIPMVYCEECAKKGIGWWDVSGVSGDQDIRKDASDNRISRYPISDALDNLVSSGGISKLAGWFPVDESDLPVELPDIKKYQPTDTGESPLANIKSFVETVCPYCGAPAQRETDTMPNWAGSDWYYLAYLFASKLGNKRLNIKDKKLNASERDFENIFGENKDILRQWMPVDVYIGGDEHNTLHLLYSRFIYQFLWDIGAVPREHPEPYYRRISHGVILGPDGARMSKSRGNVINPDDVIDAFGADTLRTYFMFMGPFEATMAWDNKGVEGVARFLNRVWNLFCRGDILCRPRARQGLAPTNSLSLQRKLHQTIKKVSKDIDSFRYNTAVAAMMEFVNVWSSQPEGLRMLEAVSFLKLLAPFAPFMAEELYQRVMVDGDEARFGVDDRKSHSVGHDEDASALRNALRGRLPLSVHLSPWPTYDPELAKEELVTIVVQVNGKLRGSFEVAVKGAKDEDAVVEKAKTILGVIKHLDGRSVKRTVFVPGKLVNFVV